MKAYTIQSGRMMPRTVRASSEDEALTQWAAATGLPKESGTVAGEEEINDGTNKPGSVLSDQPVSGSVGEAGGTSDVTAGGANQTGTDPEPG